MVRAMPDQSSASTEHAIMAEITAPLATLPDNPVPVAAEVDFPIVIRGYDRIAVDAYVKKTSQLVAELQATRSPEAAVRRALERVGEEVAGILQRAHETASQITAQSRSEAEDRLQAAREEAAQITAGAEDRTKELDLETDRIWEERLRIVEDARELARQLLTLAEAAARRFPAEETASTEVVEPRIAEIFTSALAGESVAEEQEAAAAGAGEPVGAGSEPAELSEPSARSEPFEPSEPSEPSEPGPPGPEAGAAQSEKADGQATEAMPPVEDETSH
jgi:vacuolar-type H+-ATPase subunit H